MELFSGVVVSSAGFFTQSRRNRMQKTLLALSLAAGLGIAATATAGAAPANAPALKEAATAASPLMPAQFAEHRTRHGVMKCYREFVVGPYRCHYIRNWL
jgi:hypothetical protein